MDSCSIEVEQSLHAEAAALLDAPAEEQHSKGNESNTNTPRQANNIQAAQRSLIVPNSYDAANLTSPKQTAITNRRRYSEPSRTAVMATVPNADGVRHLAAFEGFLAERDMMRIDMDYESPIHPLCSNAMNPGHVEEEHEDPMCLGEQCIGCCCQLPSQKDRTHAREAIKPCRSCNSTYCISCVKGMFLAACKDSTRMPPRCCTQIHLHQIKAHLTAEEIAEYKSKLEEWSTQDPLYCPNPSCSAFIPERLLAQQAGADGRKKVDSGIGTPASPKIKCPQCEADVCIDCRQLYHPDSLCVKLDFGVDPATAALLKAWGYKRCPKCGQGLKRMYGCNQMDCRCGAHFCWVCLKGSESCEGDCSEDDEGEDGDNETEPDEAEGSLETTITGSQISKRPRNLDGGSSSYWEQQDLDFGAEPTQDIKDRVWDCFHFFKPYKISLTEALRVESSVHHMECVKCWRTMRPEIETLPGSNVLSRTSKTERGLSQHRGRGLHGSDRGITPRRRLAVYQPPRGLGRLDATVGTAPHLTVPIRHDHSQPRYEQLSNRMDDINTEVTTVKREVSVRVEPKLSTKASARPAASDVFSEPFISFSVAHECNTCRLLVCMECMDSVTLQQENEQTSKADAIVVESTEALGAEVEH